MISIRMSDEEYRTLKTLCYAHGTRSVSDIAREAIRKLMEVNEEPDDRAFLARLEEFNGRLTLLDHEVARLSKLIREFHNA